MVGKAKDWFPGDKATHEWLDGQKKSSRHTYQTAWKYFLEYTGMTGDQIKESREADKDYAWEKRAIDFKRWMTEEKRKSEYTARQATVTVRSFFAYHRQGLDFRRTEKTKLAKAKPKYEDYRYSREDLAKMALVADLKEKYVLVAGKSFGLRAGDFMRMARGDLEAYLDREVPISIGEYATEKEGAPAFPMIDRDALPVIRLMIEGMDREGRTRPGDRMLEFKNSIQLSRVVQRLTRRAGIRIGNKRVRFHCLRKFLTDRLSSHMSESKWKQVVGKKIGEGAYVSPDSLRKDYERAMGETCFGRPAVTLEERARIVEEARKAIPEEVKREMARLGIRIAKVKKEKKSETETNGGDRQRIIGEGELEEYLERGWRVAAVLPSGKVVVESA